MRGGAVIKGGRGGTKEKAREGKKGEKESLRRDLRATRWHHAPESSILSPV